MKIGAFLATTMVAATVSLSASAQQPWVKDRRFGEGVGYRTGNLELHPGASAELGYDSNYFQRADDEDPQIAAIRLRITPSFSLSTLGPQRRGEGAAAGAPPSMSFRAGVFASYNELFAADSQYSEEVSDQRHVNAGANFLLDILPGRPWGFDLHGDYLRSVEPSNSAVEDQAFDRDSVRLGAGINWRPGGGLFEWRLGYELDYHYFERSLFQNFNNAQHYLKTRGRWRFLPRTAVVYDGHVGFIRYTDATALQHDAQVVQTRAGMNGLITHHFALLALAGWAASFYDSRGGVPVRNYDGPIAQAELKWFLLPQPTLQPDQATVGLSTIAAGYVRDYTNSYLSDYYRRDRGYLNFSYFVAGSFLLGLEGGYTYQTHSSSFFANGAQRHPSFTQSRVDASLFGEYRPSDSIGINSTLRYNAVLDDDRINLDPAGVQQDNLQFRRWEVWLGARWFM